MQSLGQLLLISMLSLFAFSRSVAQDRPKAEKSVIEFMKSRHEKYVSTGFGEFFDQTYPSEILKKMGINKEVTWSLVHSYVLGDKWVIDEYFHLDANLNVVGHLSKQDMSDITMSILMGSNKFMNFIDSIGGDTAKIRLDNDTVK